MKCLIVTFISACLISSYTLAQEIRDEDTPRTERRNPPVAARTNTIVDVTFLPTDTCNLRINGKDYGQIVKSKTIRLPLGNYKFFFESLETGETLKKRSFRLTRDSLSNGKYTLPVRFRERN
jgi:hypothetical protein